MEKKLIEPSTATKFRKISWLPCDIEKLRKDYENGKRIKVIAFELGRSATAVAKYINRAGFSKKSKNRNKACQLNFTRLVNLPDNLPRKPELTSFETVLKYLRDKGHTVYQTHQIIPNLLVDEDVYLFNTKLISKSRLLLTANRMRIEERQPIFEIDSRF